MRMNMQTWNNLRLSVDSDGVALLVMDVAGREANVFNEGFIADFCAVVEVIQRSDAIKGIILSSHKPGSFSLGADHADLLRVHESGLSAVEIKDILAPIGRAMRALEQCGKPVAAAINGAALAGGFELCLACHYRVLTTQGDAVLGLPEVKAGLLPGGGGTQRLPRLIGIQAALPLLLSGRLLPPQEALALGLVHELRSPDEVVRAARHWVLGRQQAVQPWDVKAYALPGGAGAMAAHAGKSFGIGLAQVRMATHDNEPAPLAILSCVYEGTQLPMDRALLCEMRHFSALLTGQVARNRLRTLMVNAGRVLKDRSAGRGERDEAFARRLGKALEDEMRAQVSEGVSPAMSANAARQVGLSGLITAAPQSGGHTGSGAWSIEDLRSAWLTAAALEAVRCLEEGLIQEPAQADVAAVVDLGFPAWTGGPLSYIDMLGLKGFIAQCERLALRFGQGPGQRFLPPAWLREQAQHTDAIYPSYTEETV